MNHAQIAPEEHFPFIEVMATMDESSQAWPEAKAGLVMLRLLDSWMLVDGVMDRWRLRAVRASVEEITTSGPRKMLIGRVLDSMELAKPGQMSIVAPRLMAYARSLELDAQWIMAADAYNTVVRHENTVDDDSLAVEAYLNLGRCYRMLAKWQDAGTAYAMAARISLATGNLKNFFRSRKAEAKLATDRGNLPEAEAILEESISRSTGSGLGEVRAQLLHDRAVVAQMRGQHELAVHIGYEALSGTASPAERDRVLLDLATSFFDLGLRVAARDAQLIVAATSQDKHLRWLATINLMEIASADGSETMFEGYRRELADESLPVALSAEYELYVGQGYRKFGRMDLARQHLERAVEIAAESGLNRTLITAEESIRQIEDGGAVLVSESAEPFSAKVSEVANEIRALRALAGVSG